jgi:hypothetical protein
MRVSADQVNLLGDNDFLTNTSILPVYCSVMVPVLLDTGCIMAYILYPDSTGILQELMAARPSSGSTQAITRQCPGHYPAV